MRDFTKGSIFEQLVAFSIPMLLANLLQALLGLTNSIWVGRLLGPEAFAAVSCTMPVVFFFVSGIIGLSMAANILVAQAFGAKNMDYLARVLSNSFMSSVVVCFLISGLGAYFVPFFLKIIKTPAEVMPFAVPYLRIMFLGLIFTFIYNWFGGILRGLGDAKTPLYLLIVSAVLNAALVPLCVLGTGPFPKLGIEGAAIASVISNSITIVIAYLFVLKTHVLLNVHSWDYEIRGDIIKKLFSIGIPMSMQMVLISLSEMLMIGLVNSFGVATTAAYGIGMQLDQLAFLPAMAIGMSVSSMAAQNIGAREFGRVREILKYSILLSFAISAVLFVVVFLFPDRIAAVFTKDPKIIEITVNYIRIVSVSYLIIAVMFSLHGVVRAAGDTFYMFLFTFIGLIVVRYPLAYGMVEFSSLRQKGIWAAIVLSSCVSLILSYWYYKSGKWKTRVLVKPQTAAS